MTPEDLDTVRRAYDAFARGDMRALQELLSADIEWRTTPDVPFLGNYRGIDQFLAAMNEWTEPFDEMTTDVEEIIDAGGCAIVRHRMRGRGTDSGVETDLVLWQVVTVENGRLVRMHDFATREDALAAAAG
ncbi:MAG TPA: nuclear transport factor 2 family protein [Thermoleophilaceae bacterium]|nr:nuclear transport factor 2 family protein [Thermoleophilaceae bacterium]